MDLKDVLSKVAPLLGLAVGGPGGAMIAGQVAELFGAKEGDAEDLMNKITADPEATAKLRQFQLEHDAEIERLIVEDRKDARDREVRVTQATGKTNWPMYILATVIVVGFFALIGLLMWRSMPEGSNDIAFMLFGALVASFTSVVSYFFGSSKGSADKNKLLSGLTK